MATGGDRAGAGVVPDRPIEVPSARARSLERRPAASPPPLAPTPFDSDALISQVLELRLRRDYPEAARRLREGLAQPLRPSTRERLSFELASVLPLAGATAEESCAQLRAHAREFPLGRYARETEHSSRALGCDELDP